MQPSHGQGACAPHFAPLLLCASDCEIWWQCRWGARADARRAPIVQQRRAGSAATSFSDATRPENREGTLPYFLRPHHGPLTSGALTDRPLIMNRHKPADMTPRAPLSARSEYSSLRQKAATATATATVVAKPRLRTVSPALPETGFVSPHQLAPRVQSVQRMPFARLDLKACASPISMPAPATAEPKPPAAQRQRADDLATVRPEQPKPTPEQPKPTADLLAEHDSDRARFRSAALHAELTLRDAANELCGGGRPLPSVAMTQVPA